MRNFKLDATHRAPGGRISRRMWSNGSLSPTTLELCVECCDKLTWAAMAVTEQEQKKHANEHYREKSGVPRAAIHPDCIFIETLTRNPLVLSSPKAVQPRAGLDRQARQSSQGTSGKSSQLNSRARHDLVKLSDKLAVQSYSKGTTHHRAL